MPNAEVVDLRLPCEGAMWLDRILSELEKNPAIGYESGDAPATEPTALAALSLIAHGQKEPVKRATDFLTGLQSPDGSVGVRQSEAEPQWPTSLAVLAWRAFDAAVYSPNIERGVNWILQAKGKVMEQTADMGHNTQLVGWSWAEGTHSWIEPTAFHVLALKAAGRGEHPRAREAVTLLLDRQLPSGGCNYGNTSVLGQMLRPHVQPTGIALLALAGEADVGNRMAKSVAWLQGALSKDTTPTSLAWGLLGLASHEVVLPDAAKWLEAAGTQVQSRDGSPYKLALLALAAVGPKTVLSTEY